MATLRIGERSSGTLRPQDLAETYLDMADEAGISYDDGIVISGESDFDYIARWLRHFEDHEDEPCDGETFGEHFRACPLDDGVDDSLNGAADALMEYCPPFSYVSSTEGDGASIGVWPDVDSLMYAIETEGERVDDEHAIVDGMSVFISDHGNVSLFDGDGNEIWSVV